MRYLVLLTAFLLIVLSLNAQSKKKVKENSIKTKIEWQFEYRNGIETKFKESEFKYDDDGNLVMEKYFDENGNIIKHNEFVYDSNGRLIIETAFNPKGQILKKEEFKYKGELKVEKKVFGADGKLKTKKVYEYNQ